MTKRNTQSASTMLSRDLPTPKRNAPRNVSALEAIEVCRSKHPNAASDPWFNQRILAHVASGLIRPSPSPSPRLPSERLTYGDLMDGVTT